MDDKEAQQLRATINDLHSHASAAHSYPPQQKGTQEWRPTRHRWFEEHGKQILHQHDHTKIQAAACLLMDSGYCLYVLESICKTAHWLLTFTDKNMPRIVHDAIVTDFVHLFAQEMLWLTALPSTPRQVLADELTSLGIRISELRQVVTRLKLNPSDTAAREHLRAFWLMVATGIPESENEICRQVQEEAGGRASGQEGPHGEGTKAVIAGTPPPRQNAPRADVPNGSPETYRLIWGQEKPQYGGQTIRLAPAQLTLLSALSHRKMTMYELCYELRKTDPDEIRCDKCSGNPHKRQRDCTDCTKARERAIAAARKNLSVLSAALKKPMGKAKPIIREGEYYHLDLDRRFIQSDPNYCPITKGRHSKR